MKPAVHYTVTPLIERNVFAVCMRFQSHVDGFELYLPTWIPGSYMVRDFAQHIVKMSATDAHGKSVLITPINPSTWHIAASGHVIIRYEIYAHDTSVRTAFLDGTGGFFNGTSLFLCSKAHANARHEVTLIAPKMDSNWQVATTLSTQANTTARGFGQYHARNYDELIDHPVRMGRLTWLDFKVGNVLHEVAIAGEVPYLNIELLRADLLKICSAQIDFFKTAAPFRRYVFMIDARAEGYGGLEHRDSTALLCSRNDLPTHADAPHRTDNYLTFLGLCSHEYFHAWNVKRMKPAAFVDYDLTRSVDTSLLWFFEGITSYYDDLFLLRVGILSETQFFKKLTQTINAVTHHDGARTQTIVESGFYAWTKYYQTSPNTPNAVVSYYAKGSLIGLALDLFMRDASAHQFSLDDVMHDLWIEFGHEFYQRPRGLVLNDIIRTCVQYAPTAEPLIQSMLFTTENLPLHELFQAHHIALTETKVSVTLGASVVKCDGGYQITRVFNNGAAQRANLAPNDVLLTFDKLKLSQTPDAFLAQSQSKQKIKVHFLRDGVLRHTTLINEHNQQIEFSLARINDAVSQLGDCGASPQ